MSDQCKTCPSNGGCTVEPGQCGVEPEKSLLGALNDVHNVIAIMSGKGGVGKSSVTALIASYLAKQGKKVGVLDADITGPSQPLAFGVRKASLKASEYGLIPPLTKLGIKLMSINFFLPNEDDPVIWRGPLLAGAVNQFWGEVDWRDLDYMIVDLPPGTGDVPLTVIQSLPVNGIVIVSSPQDLAFMVVKKTIKMTKKLNVPILGLVENMSYAICPHCNEKLPIFGKNQGEDVAKETGIDFLGSLPWDTSLNALFDAGNIEDYESENMQEIAKQLLTRLP
ncbi:MAG: Mrp/NBP35 family ATP-binding protein [Syntrophomonadaceae bacterium]|nr:Mrp/NBP35 family ATP-binding protein [Syntrophomonadaceae bacterium]MDD3022971.1 Mrp/NBP35 family ATP-binding protein [Syntrophomonadaceae bacterium]